MLTGEESWRALAKLTGQFNKRLPFSQTLVGVGNDAAKLFGYNPFYLGVISENGDTLQSLVNIGLSGIIPSLIPMDSSESPIDCLKPYHMDAHANGRMIVLESHGLPTGIIYAELSGGFDTKAEELLNALGENLSLLTYAEVVLRTNIVRERFEREIHFAHALSERAIPVPTEFKATPGLRLGLRSQRCLETGGDFFDIFTRKDGKTWFFIGECSGHGLKAMMDTVDITRIVHRGIARLSTPIEIAREINHHVVNNYRRSVMVSLCIGVFDPYLSSISALRVGETRMLLYRDGGSIDLSMKHGTPLGILADPCLDEETISFPPGSKLLMASNGGNKLRRVTGEPISGGWLRDRFDMRCNDLLDLNLAEAIDGDIRNSMDQETIIDDFTIVTLENMPPYIGNRTASRVRNRRTRRIE